ncbi:MAG: Asp-tRNA(Asn)/Glu-tRNA(Gln) amidotransferase subunit GatB [Verrucomicrobiae bacterium]|nr:Asp-tRNA(Asn)/Glu-tRNA(Gln) amidotransferase subunit GatB [Verrucomicrobiae bacterium]
MNYEAVIGLEVHVQLRTRTKMFCGCENEFGAAPNTRTCPVCLGLPGALPTPNHAAIHLVALTGLMLGCEIAPRCKFDRKSYFYPDMPKNYQISQYDLPTCRGGGLEIMRESYPKDAQKKVVAGRYIRLVRIHLEEDVAKSFHFETASGIDFNRAGTPLMEIVTMPDLRSPEEAFAFLSTLKLVLLYGGVSDADMEKGQLRCDCNVSVRPVGQEELGTKVEIKNMNSISGVRRALAYEIERQTEMLRGGGRLTQETRRWDEAAGATFAMRGKEMAHDYRYFPEPDLLPVDTAAWLDDVRRRVPELPLARKRRFVEMLKVSDSNAGVLVADCALADWFEKAVKDVTNTQGVANLVVNDLLRELGAAGKGVTESPVAPEALGALVALTDAGRISSSQAKEVFVEMFRTGRAAAEIVTERGLEQVSDAGAIGKLCDEVLEGNAPIVVQIRAGNAKAVGNLVGQVMKLSKGKANPAMVNAVLHRKLGL